MLVCTGIAANPEADSFTNQFSPPGAMDDTTRKKWRQVFLEVCETQHLIEDPHGQNDYHHLLSTNFKRILSAISSPVNFLMW